MSLLRRLVQWVGLTLVEAAFERMRELAEQERANAPKDRKPAVPFRAYGKNRGGTR